MREGTFAPERRASLKPIAMACFRLFTFLPDRPDLSSPRFISCIARLTLRPAFGPYRFFRVVVFFRDVFFREPPFLWPLDFFRPGMTA
ncbi:MAG: hypothetical protein JO263_05015 [Candidatus Eremiobacteraeota bacterium]|nr:hypothetical protein [Candidatus Eremiobacteraeota bacterium]